MARKHDWKKRQKKKVIEISVVHQVTEGEVHLLIVDMLHQGEKVTQQTLNNQLKETLDNLGNAWFIDPGGIPQEYKPYIKESIEIFENLFGFTPEKYHDWIEELLPKKPRRGNKANGNRAG